MVDSPECEGLESYGWSIRRSARSRPVLGHGRAHDHHVPCRQRCRRRSGSSRPWAIHLRSRPGTGSGIEASAVPASICKSDEGRRQFDELVRTSDVVVDSFSLGTTDAARHRPRRPQLHSIPGSSPVRSPPTGSTPRTVTVPATTGWSRPGPAFSMTRRDDGGQPWSSSMAVPVRTPSSMRPKGSSVAPIETVRSSRGPRGRASARPTSPRWGSPPRCAPDRSVAEGQRVTTSLLQGALAASCLNWQRVEDPGCAAVLDVARRLEVDRGPLRMCGRQMGPSLDTPPPLGPGRGRRGHALGRRARHVVPGRSRSCLHGVGRAVGGHLPPPATGGGVQEVSLPTSGSARRRRRVLASPRSGRRARRWPTSRSSPMAAWSRSTIPRRG